MQKRFLIQLHFLSHFLRRYQLLIFFFLVFQMKYMWFEILYHKIEFVLYRNKEFTCFFKMLRKWFFLILGRISIRCRAVNYNLLSIRRWCRAVGFVFCWRLVLLTFRSLIFGRFVVSIAIVSSSIIVGRVGLRCIVCFTIVIFGEIIVP